VSRNQTLGCLPADQFIPALLKRLNLGDLGGEPRFVTLGLA